MKITIRKVGDATEVYVAKKDLEDRVVQAEKPGLWGGWVEISNGWRFQLPDMPADTPMPITIDARKLADVDY